MKRHNLLLLVFLAFPKLTEDVNPRTEGLGFKQVLQALASYWQSLSYVYILSAVAALRRPDLNEIFSPRSFHVPN